MSCKGIKNFFPKCVISEYNNVGDFFLTIADMFTVDVIIVEHNLPLVKVKPDFEEQFEKFNTLFPEVVKDWTRHVAGEKIVRHLRGVGMLTPVIIYIHGDEHFIARDVMHYTNVAYCMKEIEVEELITLIRTFVK